jgi:uncharacterized protein (TIGR02302 family)
VIVRGEILLMQKPTNTGIDPDGVSRIERLIRVSKLFSFVENIWPRLWWPLGIGLIFLTLSWFGLWTALPGWGRILGVLVFGILALLSLFAFRGSRMPRDEDGIVRLDNTALDGHRPVESWNDTIAVGHEDPITRALWQAHRKRVAKSLDGVRLTAPNAKMASHDRQAWRAIPLLGAIAGLFVAGHDALPRLKSAFDWSGTLPMQQAIRIDAWIDPPGYTRLPPLVLDFAQGSPTKVRVPDKSTIIIRVAGGSEIKVEANAGLKPLPAMTEVSAVSESRFQITGDAVLALSGSRAPQNKFDLMFIRDQAPEISFTEAPQGNDRGGLTIAYRARDDYGIASVEALLSPSAIRPGSRPLIEAPPLTLTVPAADAGEEDVKSTLDLAAHPWAGAKVNLKLVVRDDAGQTGESATRTLMLPQRPFAKPLAKALIEQRRKLVMDVMERRRIQMALDAILIAPEEYTKETGTYLALNMISGQLRRARSDAQLIEVVGSLWTLALQIEDGDLSDAERQLQAAQARLQQALERGASEEEIKRLTEELRRSMDRFMREFAQRMEQQLREDPQNAQKIPENTRQLSRRDLNDMLKRIEELAKRGDTEEAQRLLEQLKESMRNLQMARPGQRDQRRQEMGEAMQELDRMTRDQQALRDETFRNEQNRREQKARPGQKDRQQQGQRGQQPKQPGQKQPGQPGQDNPEDGDQDGEDGEMGEGNQQGGQPSLKDKQRGLRDRLAELQRRMRGLGMPNQDGFGEADGAMQDAEGALGQGQGGTATDAQGRALDALRRGMDNMAKQMQPGNQDGEGDGTEQAQGGEPDPNERGRANSRANDGERDDPLGRPNRSRDWAQGNVKVPERDMTAQDRARRVLEELRRRLGDAMRPQDELDYLERLLKRN